MNLYQILSLDLEYIDISRYFFLQALDAAMKKEVEGSVAGFLTKGQKSLISYKIDPAIVGGMIVSIGDKYVDMSIASKLKKYSEIIKSAA